MIDYVEGTVLENYGDSISLLCGCISFRIFVPLSLLTTLKKGDSLSLYLHLTVPKEGTPLLYGFKTLEERNFFESLLKVHGVGAKVALSIVSHLSREEFESIVLSEDVKTLSSVPGLGKKLSQRIIVEMKEKVKPSHAVPPELLEILTSLGYPKRQILSELKDMDFNKPLEVLVKKAVLKLSKSFLKE